MKHERGDRREGARNGEESEGHMVEGGERGTGEGEWRWVLGRGRVRGGRGAFHHPAEVTRAVTRRRITVYYSITTQ